MPVCEHCADCKFSEPNCNLEVHEDPSSRKLVEVLHGYKRAGDTCGAASALLVSKRNKLVADGKGTDSGSFAKMI